MRYWGPDMKSYPYEHAPRLPGSEGESNSASGKGNPAAALAFLDPKALVPDATGPVELEVGSGRGWFTVERVDEDPQIGMIGLEIKRKWATIVDDRLRDRGLSGRARVFAEDARLVMPRFISESFSRIYVHFPDPWWKKRHHKRMVVTPEFVEEASRLLRPGGEFFVQTDVEERAEAYEQAVAVVPSLIPNGLTGGARVDAGPCSAQSPRERRAIADGLPVVRLLYSKEARPSGSPHPTTPKTPATG
jgi:tRNA (guanine-N7-)-methyltransferase